MRSPQLRCVLFPSMYLPHLLVLPATFGLQCLLPPYPYFRAFYAVPVRQVRGLLTASFRFHLAMDTLAVRLCASSLPTRTRDFHPLENAHAGQTKSGRHMTAGPLTMKNWVGRIRTYECWSQSPVPYRLATTHHFRKSSQRTKFIISYVRRLVKKKL